eukprot:scaffold79278_cov18-Prasinocladus_malaysianus.AAC.2
MPGATSTQQEQHAYGSGVNTAPPPAPYVSSNVGAGGPPGLKELLQTFAEENGMMFMPKPGRTWAGHQVRPKPTGFQHPGIMYLHTFGVRFLAGA